MKKLELQVVESDARERLDRFVARAGGIARGLARRTIEAGGVYVDGKRTKVASRGLHPGQIVSVVLEEAGRAAPLPNSELPLTVIFEDAHLIAVDKPAGIPAQATLATDRGALTSMVAAHLGLGSDRDVGLVHRLDRETSGVTVFGKSKRAVANLAEAFREGTVKKRYLAIAGGPIDSARDVDAWLAKDPSRPGLFKPAPHGTGVPAQTRVEPLSPPGPATFVACLPTTGRTHQIRVHLVSLGAPIVGDRKYGGPARVQLPKGELVAERVLLHAERLELRHPITCEAMVFRSPPPADIVAAAQLLDVALG